MRQLASDGLLLDRLLGLYGDATTEQCADLKHAAESGLERIWPHDPHEKPKLGPGEAVDFEHLYFGIANLQPENDGQRALNSCSLDLTTGLAQTRFRLFCKGDAIPRPFLVILVFWLMVLLGGAGLFGAAQRDDRGRALYLLLERMLCGSS